MEHVVDAPDGRKLAVSEGGDADELRALMFGSGDARQPPAPMEPDDVVRATYLVESCGGR